MRILRSGRSLRGVLAAAALVLCGFSASVLAEPIVGVQGGTTLVFFDSASPSGVVATRTITGLQGGETIVAIDTRPATGGLYGLSSAGRIYLINPNDGSLLQIGTGALTLSGTAFGMDFNPTVDRIRIVSDTGQNLRAHPDTGALVLADGALNGAATGAVGAAYTNNFAGATTTLVQGRGVTSAARLSAGAYTVDFQTDISSCFLLATAIDITGGSVTPMTLGTVVLDTDTVIVQSVNDTGATTDMGDTDGFTLAAFC